MESTLNNLENSATRLGNILRTFKNDVCTQYPTRDLPSEEAARGRRQAAKAQKAGGGTPQPANPAAASKFRDFNMETYKLHGLPDYPASIRAYGVTENTSTKNVCYLFVIHQLYLTWLQGEGEHKRSKQFYPRVRKGDHVRGIARHVYRERTLFQAQQALKKKPIDENPSRSKEDGDSNTLNIPLSETELLGPTPPEVHHHILKDVRHKVDVLKWVADNRDDPALEVCN